jgi:hydrogenase/urease accessory protein HupE
LLKYLAKKHYVIGFGIATIILFSVIVMISSMSENANGASALRLQVAFDKSIGIKIVSSWKDEGVEHFKSFMMVDYIYAFAYSFFLSSFLAWLLYREEHIKNSYQKIVYIPFLIGILDMIENTMELQFVEDIYSYSSKLFYLHSILATTKWLLAVVVLVLISIFALKRSIKE